MSEPFLAEIQIIAFNFAPRGWAYCDGQILPINQNQSLYSLLGTTYGGDGRTTFGLPDLRGRVPIHVSPSHSLGQKSGAETVTLNTAQIASHDHVMAATDADATTGSPSAALYAGAAAPLGTPYSATNPTLDTQLNANSIQPAGNAAHENMQPFLTLGYCIALQGLFPSRN